jgi:hypothetical protein
VSERAVLDLGVLVLLWDGREDAHHAPMQPFAATLGFELLSTPGDHVRAMEGSADLTKAQNPVSPTVEVLVRPDFAPAGASFVFGRYPIR